MTNIDNNHDFEFVQIDKTTNKNTLFSPFPKWINKSWAEEMKPFVYIKNTVVHPSGTKFASFYAFFKHWRLYDNETKLVRDISVQIPPYSDEIEEVPLERMVYYRGYPQASEKYIYVLCKNQKYTDINNNTELQVWTWNGNPIAIFNLDQKIDLFVISENERRIYALNTDEGHEDKIYVYSIPISNSNSYAD
jgi:hypothetical protein